MIRLTRHLLLSGIIYNIEMKKNILFSTILIALSLVQAIKGLSQTLPEDIRVERIYSDENYNAFTSLLRFKERFYCAFRSGEAHVYGKDGITKIISSKDGKNWKEVASLSVQGYDLRDPKLSVTPDGKIMVIMGGSIYEGENFLGGLSHVSFSNNKGTKFTAPQPVQLDPAIKTDYDWLWRVSWYEGTGYGAVYKMKEESDTADISGLRLVETRNGIDYHLISELEIGGRPNETTIRIMPDGEMLMLVRREEGDRKACLGKSKAPYTSWTFLETPFFIGGPDFIALDDDHFVGGGRIDGQYTGLISFTREGDFKEVLRLPSNSDSSYPGLVLENGKLFVSYYSSHETGVTSIYLAEIPISYAESRRVP